MGFFDFLTENERYGGDRPGQFRRLNRRHDMIVTPYAADLGDARVLDLASHDGRWPYALAAAGAREVVGVEARAELVAEFDEFPGGPVKDRVRLIAADVYDELPAMVARGETFDVVALFGLFYHVMDHYRMLKLIAQLQPRLVIVDSEFATVRRPVIELVLENTSKRLNTIAHVAGQPRAPIGIPSPRAMEMMAESLGYGVTWTDWEVVPEDQREGLHDYFRSGEGVRKRRGTCALRPLS